MNRVVTIDELARTVAQFTKSEPEEALAFIRDAFMLAADTLIEGEAVEIRSVGTFMPVDGVLRFRPDSELAEAINAPFSAFQAVEVADPSVLDEPDQEPACDADPDLLEENGAEAEIELLEQVPEISGESETEPESEVEPEPEPAPENDVDHDEPTGQSAHEDQEHSEPQAQPATPARSASDWILPLLLALLCLTVGFVMGRLSAPRTVVTMVAPVENCNEIETSESVDEISANEPVDAVGSLPESESPVASAPKVRTDTIRSGRFLTTMAREHYGQMEYWVYIYLENADKLGNPDRIEPGTVVLIPPAEKYGLVAGDQAKIAEAKAKAAEIYKKH